MIVELAADRADGFDVTDWLRARPTADTRTLLHDLQTLTRARETRAGDGPPGDPERTAPGALPAVYERMLGPERSQQLGEMIAAARLQVAYGRVSDDELPDRAARLEEAERALDGPLGMKVVELEERLRGCDRAQSDAAERELDLYERLAELGWWQRSDRVEVLAAADAQRGRLEQLTLDASEISDELGSLSGRDGHPDRWMRAHGRRFAEGLVAREELGRERTPAGASEGTAHERGDVERGVDRDLDGRARGEREAGLEVPF